MDARSKIFLYLSMAVLCGCSGDNNGTSGGAGWPDDPSASSSNVVVMSYNTRHCAPFEGSGVETQPDVDGIARVIKSKSPDVVLLQEIDSCTTRSNGVDQAKKIAELAKYPYHHFFKHMDYRNGKYGLAMLSKKPFKETVTHVLPKTIGNHTIDGDYSVGEATISIDGTDMTFVVAHLSVYASDVEAQLPYIHANILSKIKRPVIFGGDFNSLPSSNAISMLDGYGFIRTNTDPKNLTIPSTKPTREIDYITYYPVERFDVVSHTVITGTNASDHLPIVAVLKVNK